MFRKLKLEQGQKVLGGRMVFISDLLDGRVGVRSTSLCCSSGPRKLLCLSRPGRLLKFQLSKHLSSQVSKAVVFLSQSHRGMPLLTTRGKQVSAFSVAIVKG